MGVLMLNDINYSGGGGAEEMTLAQYEALSQAEKNDGKIRFITDVDAGITWELAGEASSTNPVSISQCNEILVVIKLSTYDIKLTINIPYIDLISTDVQYRSGYSERTSIECVASVYANKSSVRLESVILNTSAVTSSSSIKVYYR